MIHFELTAKDPFNPSNLIENAKEYISKKCYAQASAQLLRAANYSHDDNEVYSCLVKAAECYSLDGCDWEFIQRFSLAVISSFPSRPEMYWLFSNMQFEHQNYHNAYLYASIGINNSGFHTPLIFDIGYTSIGNLYIAKAMAAWWVDKPGESRDLFSEVTQKYIHDVNEKYAFLTTYNLYNLAQNDYADQPRRYTRDKKDSLVIQFNGLDSIEQNFSRSYEDLFVLSMLNGKENGFFVEVGSDFSIKKNNTYLLETCFGWHGFAFKADNPQIEDFRNNRPAVRVEPMSKMNYEKRIYDKISNDNIIDYFHVALPFDANLLEFLQIFPFDRFRCRVLTVAHNDFADRHKLSKMQSREFFTSKGYTLVAKDVSISDKFSFEDWWVDESLVDSSALQKLKTSTAVFCGEKLLTGKLIDNYNNIVIDDTPINELYTIQKYTPRVWIVDNFYKNPEAIREFALAQEYHQGGLYKDYIGRRTFQQFLFPGLKETFEKIMGMKITKWEEYGMNGRFQTNWGGDPLAYHTDAQSHAAMIYLTPNAPFSCGTTLHAHKKTRVRHASEPQIMKCFEGINLDSTIYEPVDVIGNVFNRLVIFDARCIHSASNYFGYDAQTGRLWHMFFFDAEEI